jgi:hypothetical protein
MVQYEFGQSLEGDLPWAPDPPQAASAPSPLTVRSVYHRVFRVKQGRAASHPLSGSDLSSDGAITWAIHYGFDRAMGNGRPCSGILQQHAGTLCEEAGKFIGRHCVRIDWVGNTRETRTAIAREERQLTVKDLRGRNGSYAMWIDFASTLSPAAGPMRIDDAGPLAGFRFVPSIDSGAVPEYRQSGHWRAITFVSEGSAYTAVCFNSPSNPKPLVEERADRNRDCGPTGLVEGIGYRFSAQLDERNPLLIHYRLWIQGGRMPSEEIQSMADDFVEPITIAVK